MPVPAGLAGRLFVTKSFLYCRCDLLGNQAVRPGAGVPVRHYSVSVLVLHSKRNKRDSFVACFSDIFSADVFDIFLKLSSHYAVGLEYIGIGVERAHLLQKIEITVFEFRFSLICCRITHIVCSEIDNYNIRLVPFKIPRGF